MKFHAVRRGLALAAFAVMLAAQAGTTARVTYARSFKTSTPAFFQIEVGRDGPATYQVREKAGDPTATLTFSASPQARKEIFSAAAALGDFARPKLQSKRKVAYTGDKMLAYDDAGHHSSQAFTYTRNAAAKRLVVLFEKMGVTGMDTIRLRRAVLYQPLDVLEIMDQIQGDWNGRQMAEPEMLAPTLRALVANGAIMAAARKRARKLLAAFGKKK